MRIVIDLQGAQSTGSRNRGIGRYTLWLTEALIRNRGQHEVHLVLSNAFPETIDELRSQFGGLLPPNSIHTWDISGPTAYMGANEWHRQTAEVVREAFLAKLRPDMVLIALTEK